MAAIERPRGSGQVSRKLRGGAGEKSGVDRRPDGKGNGEKPKEVSAKVRDALALADAEIRAQYLTSEMLSLDEVTEEGGEIMGGKGKLMRLLAHEDREFLVRLKDNLITPNPKQPRKYFDEEKLEELKGTIESQGQKSAIVVVPYFDGDNIKLFIIDGERRLRVLQTAGKEFIRVVIRWAKDEEEIFEQSLILNESKADHNPIERAEAYQQLMKFQEDKGVPNPIQVVAKRLGIPDYKISNHLKLLALPDVIKEMVIKGTLPLKNALIIRQQLKKYGQGLPIAQLAQALMDADRSDDPRAPKSLGGRGGMTREDVTRAVRGVLAEGGHVDAASELGAQKAVYDATFGIGRMQAGINRLSGADPNRVVGVLRNRKGEPPELIRDRLDEVERGLKEIRALVERAIKPDPLEKVPGKPAFFKYMEGKRKAFGNEVRYNIACLLAKSSDKGEGEVMMVSEIAKRLGISANDFASNRNRLELDLKGIGLRLDEQVAREKAPRIKKGERVMSYEQRPAYRLQWRVKGQEEADNEDDEDAEVPQRGGLPEDLFDGDDEGEGRDVDEDAVVADVELRTPRGRGRGTDRASSPRAASPDRIAELKASFARVQEQERTAPVRAAAPARPTTAPARVSVRPPDILAARHPVSAPEHLKNVAQQIAQQVSLQAANVAVRHCAQFGARLGIKIEERARPGVSAYIVSCNMRAFATNFGAYKSSFADWIAGAVGKKSHEVEVHLRDVE